jgi:YVTN family beta-propeller protein
MALAGGSLGVDACQQARLPASGAALFTSPQTRPLALSADGTLLYVANTTAGSVSMLDVSKPAAPLEIAEIKVGLDPVGIAVRPKASPDDDEYVYVTNHVSDSISVISRAAADVVQTLQGIDPATGVTTTDEPVGIAFAGPSRAFVSLDHPNEVLVIDVDAAGRATIRPERLAITAQAPRALAVSDGRLYVAAFESGNQTEFPSCEALDPRGLAEGDASDEGCQFPLRLLDGIRDLTTFEIDVGVIIEFAANSPNLGGRVIRDRDVPDRDLFVFDARTLAPIDVVPGVGTLLYDVGAGSGGRVYVTNTEARNHLDGLAALDNRMFDNRLALLECSAAGCASPTQIDLEGASNALGVTVPTPYGLAVSADGATLVVSVAGSDGEPTSAPGTPPGQARIPGLVTLDADGNVLGAVPTGAIPQGVVLASNAAGAASTAYVLNTVESSVSVVDVSTPSAPRVIATLPVGSDPTPPLVRRGRIAFSSARASTSGTFSCESCHPNGNTDQLLWTINSVNGPDEGPDPDGEHPEPRTTMPIRGLRDTLPLHWDGTLGDPFGGPNGADKAADLPPSCDLDDEQSCFRHLVDASLRGVMCAQDAGCPTGVASDVFGVLLPGALDDADRDAMAVFLSSVSYPPSPKRRPSDVLSGQANLGVQDFFTDEDGLGLGGGNGIGNAVGFAPITCADNSVRVAFDPGPVGSLADVLERAVQLRGGAHHRPALCRRRPASVGLPVERSLHDRRQLPRPSRTAARLPQRRGRLGSGARAHRAGQLDGELRVHLRPRLRRAGGEHLGVRERDERRPARPARTAAPHRRRQRRGERDAERAGPAGGGRRRGSRHGRGAQPDDPRDALRPGDGSVDQ